MKIRYLAYIFCLFLFFAVGVPAVSDEGKDDDSLTILATSKIAGACGILDEMITFQSKTKLKGGDEFVYRFWMAESARLGKTVQEMSELCDLSILKYEQMREAIENDDG